MPGSCSSAISVYLRGGSFRFRRASSSTAGICFSRATSERSLSSGGAKSRLMITNALPVMPLEVLQRRDLRVDRRPRVILEQGVVLVQSRSRPSRGSVLEEDFFEVTIGERREVAVRGVSPGLRA